MLRLTTQSFAVIVSRDYDVSDRTRGCERAYGRAITPPLQTVCCLRLILMSGWYAVRAADGFLDFKTPVETSTSPDTVSSLYIR